MRKTKAVPQPVYTPPSRLVWDDDRLAALDKQQLANLLDNIPTQLEAGRISIDTASDLERRILSRLPKSVTKKRAKSEEEAIPEDDHAENNGVETEK